MKLDFKHIARTVIVLTLIRFIGFGAFGAENKPATIDLDSGLRPSDFIFADQLPKSEDTLGHFEQWSFLLISAKSVRSGIPQRDTGGRIGRDEAEDRLVLAA
jgi:hypothetical protein